MCYILHLLRLSKYLKYCFIPQTVVRTHRGDSSNAVANFGANLRVTIQRSCTTRLFGTVFTSGFCLDLYRVDRSQCVPTRLT